MVRTLMTKSQGIVFVIKERGSDYYKIDTAISSLDNVLIELQYESPHELYPVFERRTNVPHKLKQELSSMYNSRRIRGEWFRLDEEDIIKIGKILNVRRIRVAKREKEAKRKEHSIEDYEVYKQAFSEILTSFYLEENYARDELTIAQIAEKTGCRCEVVRELLEDSGFRLKTKYKLKDGRQFNLTKDEAIEQGGGVCQICERDTKITGKPLHVHYKDYNPRNKTNHNMIPVCNGCLRRTRRLRNRDYWIWYFKRRLDTR